MRECWRQGTDLIKKYNKILISGHVRPDGDCVGSTLALYLALCQMGKEAVVVLQDDIGFDLQFLPHTAKICTPNDIPWQPELFIIVDCPSLSRCGEWAEKFVGCQPILVLDHHIPNGEIYDCQIIDDQAAAAAEIVYDLLADLGAIFNSEIATCLYAAISSDTGSFMYSNTSPHTFLLAAKLLSCGVATEDIRRHLFEIRTVASTKMLAVALMNMETSYSGRLAWTYIDEAAKKKYQALESDCDKIAPHTLCLPEAMVGAFFEECASIGRIKVSLRCRPPYDVAVVASSFGGGGHVCASGCRIAENMPKAMNLVLTALKEMMKRVDAN